MSIAKGEVKVDVDKIVNLEKEVANLNQIVGAQRESIDNLKSTINGSEKKHNQELEELTDKLQKEVKIVSTEDHIGMYGKRTSLPKYEYKGLDDVVDMIRKEESKKIKADNIALEEERDDFSFKLEKAEKRIKKLEKESEVNIAEAKSRLRERLNGIIDEKNKEIDELKEEIIKIQEDRTDDQIEEARKQEIVDLKAYVEEIKKDKEALIKLLPLWKRKKFENKKAELEALIEKTEKEDAIENISNKYPKVRKANKFNTWMKSVKDGSWISKAEKSKRYDLEKNDEYDLEKNDENDSISWLPPFFNIW